MNSLTRKTLASCLITLVVSAPALSQDSAAEIADAYLDAYARVDAQPMGALLAEDAIFSDRGSFDIQGGPYHYEGRDAIIAAITQFNSRFGLYQIAYDNQMSHEASGQAVYAAEVEARWRMADGQDRVGRGDIVTTIRVRDGQVVEHLDMPDYAGGTMTIENPAAD